MQRADVEALSGHIFRPGSEALRREANMTAMAASVDLVASAAPPALDLGRIRAAVRVALPEDTLRKVEALVGRNADRVS